MKADSIQDIYELSPLQQGILFHSLYAPESVVYFVQLCYSLKGNFNVVTFEQAWQEVVNRHTVLRTAFYWENLEKPLQVVHREVKVSLIQHDWRGINSNEQPQKLQEFLESDRTSNLYLIQPCLMRLHLIRYNDDCYYFIWSKHHLILDGWSTALVLKEVVKIYQSLYQGKNLPLILDASFGDYIGWLQQQDLNKAKEFWQQLLQGVTAPTPLINLNTQDSFKQPEKYNQQVIKLSQTTTAALQSLARQNQLTLNTLIQGAYALLLSRYSRETDVVYGVTVSGRPADLVNAESMVGMFINTLPVRVQIDAEESLLSWLRKLQSQLAEIRQYEYSPLVEVQGWSEVPRGLPLFESILVFENYPVDRILKEWQSNLEVQSISAVDNTNYPLTVSVIPGEKLEIIIDYQTNRFDFATINRMLGHFQTLLQGMVNNPHIQLKDLPLLTYTEKHQLLVEWNSHKVDYPQNLCIHKLFEKVVEQNPDAIAVEFAGKSLTYQQLNQRANKVAHYLQKLGVIPDQLVGICVERSLEMAIALLGILKAGCAYVPLDPDQPQQRLKFMLEDAGCSILLTQKRLIKTISTYAGKVICLDADWELIANEEESNPTSNVQPENLAYLIYTSGSTGKPKGVMIQHQSLVNFTEAAKVKYEISSSDRILQFASISFDAAAEEIYPCLTCGATLVLRTDEMLDSVSIFMQKCKDLELTVLDLPTAYWHLIVSELANGNYTLPESLRMVIIGGEQVLPEKVTIWQKHLGSKIELINTYGPTEATVVATLCNLSTTKLAAQVVPIGRPYANSQLYILDANLQPVPIGVMGELYIGGDGLARGYHNRPDLTAEKFIPNIFSPEPKAQLYKTGDLVRYLPDSNIEFLGRIDNQVKIRGFRIELGEIEALLSQHLEVKETVVVVREDNPGDKRLVAYIVPNHILPTSEIRNFLKGKLPEYMIPSAFVQLDTLPVTPNGKIDRRALPAPVPSNLELENSFVPPRTAVEEILTGIWAKILHVEQVGIHDNFFELGGDSILSLQVIAKANQAGLQLSLKQIFEYQTIADLALVAGITTKIATEQGIVKGSLPLTPIQHWFFEQEFLDSHHWNQSVILEVEQTCNPILLEQVVNQLILHHDALRSRFEKTEFGWQSIIGQPENITPFYTIDLSSLPEHEQIHSIKIKANTLQASLNLSKAQLVQFALFVLGKDKPNRLLIIIHHLAVDGVSWRILLEDLQTAYQQLIHGEKIQLPAKTTSVKQWAEKLQEYAKLDTIKSEINYWLNQPYQNIAPLPIDYLNGDNTFASACTVSVSLTPEETESLLHEVPAAYQTQINDILLTAIVQTFHQWTGNSSLLINLEGHGREDILDNLDLSRTVGWFTTIFPVLLDITSAFDPGEALKKVKEKLRSIPRKGINYGALRYLSQKSIAEKLQALPQAEVIFNYLGQFDQVLSETSIFRPASESAGETQSPRASRDYLLEVNGLIVNGQLRLNWTYSKALHQQTTIEKLAQTYIEKLRSLIVHCQSPNAGSYTPSDFPQMQFNQQELDQLMAELG
ncbi:non-ribosomal peptide synthetase [aff. Roholtiella sp. LEGE 12411]|uniref:non-ribosomal peptide synthetase n=1 Tax=aff. Roholtiella sp. LEGE 12411 TaxID=1828822 RepID=UPI001880F9DD|nr:non-ribosomal peptide synthetase [aff. Roholtiella sp. LEGE 12411]MBE9034047.1 amino acid adenylation domain-containing protein [aff. Roholtiella sp. LEGE 12411]